MFDIKASINGHVKVYMRVILENRATYATYATHLKGAKGSEMITKEVDVDLEKPTRSDAGFKPPIPIMVEVQGLTFKCIVTNVTGSHRMDLGILVGGAPPMHKGPTAAENHWRGICADLTNILSWAYRQRIPRVTLEYLDLEWAQ